MIVLIQIPNPSFLTHCGGVEALEIKELSLVVVVEDVWELYYLLRILIALRTPLQIPISCCLRELELRVVEVLVAV